MTLRHRLCSGPLLWSGLCKPRFGRLSWRLYWWSCPRGEMTDSESIHPLTEAATRIARGQTCSEFVRDSSVDSGMLCRRCGVANPPYLSFGVGMPTRKVYCLHHIPPRYRIKVWWQERRHA